MFKLKKILLLCTVFVAINCGKKTVTPQPIDPTPVVPTPIGYTWDKFSMGADLSYVNEIQDAGGVYKDSNVVKDPFVIFKNHGTNTVRVRLWHNPTWKIGTSGRLYSDLYDVEKTIKRAKTAGMAVNLDFHYSDDWADPAQQVLPAAWKNATATTIKDSVYNYTLAVLNYLKSKNLTPEMVQIGNENNDGMLHPFGKPVSGNWKNFGDLVNSGIKAVRDFSQNSTIKPQIIIHVAQLQNGEWWANSVTTSGGITDFDILGLSHYAKWSTITTMDAIGTTIKNLKTKYGKKVMIVETAFPWTTQNADGYNNILGEGIGTYGISKEEHLRYMKDLTQAVITAGGTGIMYWEPAWISSPMKDRWGTGSSWENNAYFDFQGNALPIFDWMIYAYKF